MLTSDNPNEIFDIVDLDDSVIGQKTRMECNTNPKLIHRCIFILVYNDQGEILWQKRSMGKDTAPGLWVTSVSGHVDAGEDYQQAANREIKEELGIGPPLEFLGKFLFRYPEENEFSAIFKADSNGPFPFDCREISEVSFMTVQALLEKEQRCELELTLAAHHVIKALSLC